MATIPQRDITVIYLTANQQPESWVKYQRQILLDAIGDYPLISVSREPMEFGRNLIDRGPKSHINMYYQLLQAAKMATTQYIATAEDDVLYSKEHFSFYRPPLDTFAYNMSRWSLYTWAPIYSLKQRISNCTLIAPREKLIEAWEERFAKYPGDSMPHYFVCELGRNSYERQLGVTQQKMVQVYSEVPVIHFNHINGTDPLSLGKRKRLGQIKALDIPYWGRAEDLVKYYA